MGVDKVLIEGDTVVKGDPPSPPPLGKTPGKHYLSDILEKHLSSPLEY